MNTRTDELKPAGYYNLHHTTVNAKGTRYLTTGSDQEPETDEQIMAHAGRLYGVEMVAIYRDPAPAVGQRVICNGFPGAISEVCTGQLAGMVVVRLERGSVCVAASRLTPA